jgi:drug/metabolite transporter (DMT)-like permease
MGAPVLAVVALFCFAANSVLARLALRAGAIDPGSFTAIRLAAGAVFLALLARPRQPITIPDSRFPLIGALLLFLYAAPFSFAYVRLTTGTGALILFGAVQLTMIGAGLFSGERPHPFEWIGLVLALGGLVGLTLPGISAPPPLAALLMALAGIAWGGYSLRGRRSSTPLTDTAASFALATPIGVALALLALIAKPATLTTAGVLYATVSGALASGAGYAAWYAALPRLSATRAGTIQLAVPVLTAALGTTLLDERISVRLTLSALAILGGIAISISARKASHT